MRAMASNCSFPLNLEVDTTDSLSAVAGHICVSYRGCLICWGGYCYDEREIHYRETDSLYIFPYMLCGVKNNIWLKIRCESDLQLRPNSGATANVHQDQLYIFGGCLFDDLHRRMINTSMLIAIDLQTGILRAKQIPPNGCIPTPRDKTTSWIADEKFYIFGGYGMSYHRLDHGQEYFFQPWSFLDDDMGSCWNNQLLYYDLRMECWQEAKQGGKKPSQRAAAASVFVPQLNQVFLFGGRHDQTRLNDLYSLDLATHIWTQIDPPTTTPENNILCPVGRSWCTMVHLNGEKKILCYGGLSSTGEPLGDLWELDIAQFYEQKSAQKREHWRQIPPLEHQLPNRLWHCSILMGNEAILIYGGMNESPSSDSPFVRTLLVKPIRPPTLRQLALNSLTEQIIRQWREEMATSRNALKSPFCGQISPPPTAQVDLQCFANSTGIMASLPKSLHPNIRILLSIQKHSKSLKPSGGTTPRSNSPFPWQPTPSNFHLLNLDGIRREMEEDGQSNSLGLSHQQRNSSNPHWNVPPLSPKSQKRSLADELFKHICECAKHRGTPFLEALFHSFDPL